MEQFSEKNILIIGGSTGIGLEIIKKLKSENANIFVGSRHKGDLDENIKHFEVDINGDISQLINNLPPTLHGVVYCPGSINLKPFGRLTENDFLNDFKINVLGAVKILQSVITKLKNSNGASVVLFSTIAVKTGLGFHASIAAAKGGVEGLTVSLAAEFAQSKIRFNAIAPSLTDTPLASSLLSTPEKKEASNKRHPLGRYGTADDIASAAIFLLSDQSSWMTGQILNIDGGMSVIKSF